MRRSASYLEPARKAPRQTTIAMVHLWLQKISRAKGVVLALRHGLSLDHWANLSHWRIRTPQTVFARSGLATCANAVCLEPVAISLHTCENVLRNLKSKAISQIQLLLPDSNFGTAHYVEHKMDTVPSAHVSLLDNDCEQYASVRSGTRRLARQMRLEKLRFSRIASAFAAAFVFVGIATLVYWLASKHESGRPFMQQWSDHR
eukprot:Polyplicarium_translucidae@DN2238_c0_g1_i2.p1